MTTNIKYDQKNVRKYHYFMLLSLIQKHKSISRSKLAELTKISNTTVGKIVKDLIEDHLVIEVGQIEGDLGRRATLLEINPQGAYIIGVQIDVNNVNIALVSLNGNLILKRNLIFDDMNNPKEALSKIADEIEIMICDFGTINSKKIIAIGISIPGLVTWPDGKVLSVPQLQWYDIEIKSFLEQRLNYDIFVDNDVRSVLLAESLFGTIGKYKNAVCIYIGSGVGGAVMINGEISRGSFNTLGEIGHTTLDRNGPLCSCGRMGCLQTYLCSSELEKQAQKPIHEIFKAYHEGNDWAKRLILQAKQFLGIAISNVICSYNPEVVLLAGPMVQEYPELVEGINDIAGEFIWAPLRNSFTLVKADIGTDSGVIGASALVLNEFLRHSNELT
ncbi:ROK family transcriptional regulator [Fredinandcohnia onubensis]|uniref:ROK family transcriptional regulator n=1 Tax=Fredinandcohnia onubensis TaxID=1571209 RepID=UPI000C0BC7DA|nr:ROK family transcriptional regulator [Fredinandcohnia onubensis]